MPISTPNEANSKPNKRSLKSHIKQCKSEAFILFIMYKTQTRENPSTVVKISTGFISHYFKNVQNKSFWNNRFEVDGQLTNSIVLKYSIACYLRYYQKQLTKMATKFVLIFDELVGKCLYKEHSKRFCIQTANYCMFLWKVTHAEILYHIFIRSFLAHATQKQLTFRFM